MLLDFRPIVFVTGVLLSMIAIAMLVPTMVDLYVGNQDWQVFLLSSGFTMFTAGLMILTTRQESKNLNIRQAFVMTTMVWIILPAFSALPFLAANALNLSYTDAFFEAMSGLTTTGSTVVSGLESAPPGILMWRSILQWMGGVGIVVMAISILPMLQIGGMQLFRMEFSDRIEKALPRAAQIGTWIFGIYIGLSGICAYLFWLAGMSTFDAINHAMTTVATGGFSTHDASFGYFDSAQIEAITTIFMILGSLPFLLYLQLLRKDWKPFFEDTQVRWFFGILGTAVGLMTGYLMVQQGYTFFESLRHTSFNVVSIMTGTGFASTDYSLWGAFAMPLFFLIMFIGGCAGSTTCGIKIFRFQVLFETARTQMRSLLQPNGVFISYYNGKPISEQVSTSVMAFFFMFAAIFALLAMALGLLGMDFVTATSAAGTALANVGPGLGEMIGPSGNFSQLPDAAKWLLSLGMLLGRLEIFTVLIMFTSHFWKD
ncbi:TrkH family potassium uptake protein [Curvivirga sp.]|uniref:TrkH family potassium uptake protein n=1 Tax=Curvivirga sp. TaxID=2856848 RepID=UPI003B5BC2D8